MYMLFVEHVLYRPYVHAPAHMHVCMCVCTCGEKCALCLRVDCCVSWNQSNKRMDVTTTQINNEIGQHDMTWQEKNITTQHSRTDGEQGKGKKQRQLVTDKNYIQHEHVEIDERKDKDMELSQVDVPCMQYMCSCMVMSVFVHVMCVDLVWAVLAYILQNDEWPVLLQEG